MTATYPEGYFPGSEEERQMLQRAAEERDAKAEAERVAALPEKEDMPPVKNPALSHAERAELEALRAERAASGDGANRPYQGDGK